VSPFTFELDPFLGNQNMSGSSTGRKKLGVPFASQVNVGPQCFALSNDGRVVFSCGYWDNTFKLSLVESSRLLQSVLKHKDIVTCLALDGRTLVTGSRDTTLMVWDVLSKTVTNSSINSLSSSNTIQNVDNTNVIANEVPLHILYGHDDEVTYVAVSVELDICVSGSIDGTCILHNLRRGQYVRTLCLPKSSPIRMVSIAPPWGSSGGSGYIIVYSQADLTLYLFSINGRLLRSADEHERLNHMIITRDGEFIITGGEKGSVVLRHLHNLKFAHKFSVQNVVCSLVITPDEKHLHVGLDNGKLLIIARPPTDLKVALT